jgi:flagellar hook-basal body complex protein FliE
MAGDNLNVIRLVPGLVERPQEQNSGVKNLPSEQEGKFQDLFSDLLNSVNQLQNESADIQQAFLSGEPVELHQVMIKAEEAGLAMDLLLEIRNRLITAYNDLMRMPI